MDIRLSDNKEKVIVSGLPDMGGKDIVIPSAMWPLNGKTSIILNNDNTVPCEDEGIRSIFDELQFSVGACYNNAFTLCEALRNAGYKADTYAGWIFVGDTIPAHHCVVILNENTVLDPTVIDYRKMALDKLDKREAVVDFLKSMQDKPKSSYTTFGQVLPGMMYFVSKCEARAAHRTRAKLEKAYPNHPAFGRFMKGKNQTPMQEMIANAGLSTF